MAQVILLVVLFITLPIVAFAVFPLALSLLMSPLFWIIMGLFVIGTIIYMVVEKNQKGFLKETAGYVYFPDVDSSKYSTIRLYPDKITINDVQTIPIERVKKAKLDIYTQVVGGPRYKAKRHTYSLTIHFKNKNGRDDSIVCKSKINSASAHLDYMSFERKLNKHVGYIKTKPNFPDKPYEL